MLQFLNKIPPNLRTSWQTKLTAIANELGTTPEILELIMYYETAKTLSPSIRGGYKSAYVGLIQFGAAACKDLGTSQTELVKLNHVEQLDYVRKYLKRYAPFTCLSDVYLAILLPSSLKVKGFNTPLPFTLKQKAANKQFLDTSGDITRSSISSYLGGWVGKNKAVFPETLPTDAKALMPSSTLYGGGILIALVILFILFRSVNNFYYDQKTKLRRFMYDDPRANSAPGFQKPPMNNYQKPPMGGGGNYQKPPFSSGTYRN